MHGPWRHASLWTHDGAPWKTPTAMEQVWWSKGWTSMALKIWRSMGTSLRPWMAMERLLFLFFFLFLFFSNCIS
jgi:sensor histidine kinase YesM